VVGIILICHHVDGRDRQTTDRTCQMYSDLETKSVEKKPDIGRWRFSTDESAHDYLSVKASFPLRQHNPIKRVVKFELPDKKWSVIEIRRAVSGCNNCLWSAEGRALGLCVPPTMNRLIIGFGRTDTLL